MIELCSLYTQVDQRGLNTVELRFRLGDIEVGSDPPGEAIAREFQEFGIQVLRPPQQFDLAVSAP
jgi:hypothetical protein